MSDLKKLICFPLPQRGKVLQLAGCKNTLHKGREKSEAKTKHWTNSTLKSFSDIKYTKAFMVCVIFPPQIRLQKNKKGTRNCHRESYWSPKRRDIHQKYFRFTPKLFTNHKKHLIGINLSNRFLLFYFKKYLFQHHFLCLVIA